MARRFARLETACDSIQVTLPSPYGESHIGPIRDQSVEASARATVQCAEYVLGSQMLNLFRVVPHYHHRMFPDNPSVAADCVATGS